jgi:predicted metal-binding membrane protein
VATAVLLFASNGLFAAFPPRTRPWYVRGVTGSPLERILLRDRLLIAIALGLLTIVSWVHMLTPDGPAPDGERLMPCCGARFGVTVSMWVVMMAGMMIPAVAPMVLSHAAIIRRRAAHGAPFVSSGLFLTGYLLAWGGFSLVAAFAQWALYRTALLDGRSLSIGPAAGGAVLLFAGVFQLSPAKSACLSHCRAPLGYFLTEWREGHVGAVSMGLRHGLFCIGCCWLLMAVLFAVGIMNIVWGAAITAFVVAEKILPWRRAVVWSGAVTCLLGAAALAYRAALGT